MSQTQWTKGQRGKLPDGTLVEFDGQGFLPVDVSAEAGKPRTWSDKLGLNTPDSGPVSAFAKGATGAAVDMAEGVKASAAQTVYGGGDLIRRGLGMDRIVDQPEVQDEMTAPDTVAGTIGEYAPAVAGAAGLVKAGVRALPSAARAGQKFQSVMAAAKDIPIDVAGPGNVALRIGELAERGASMPKAVNDFLKYATNPQKPPMDYKVARDFASNIGRLSAKEVSRLNPVMQKHVADLSVALNESIVKAAQAAGKADEYVAAMNEYRKAMQLRDFVKKAIPIAAAGGAASYAANKVRGMVP